MVRDQEEKEEEDSVHDAVIATAQDLPIIIFAVAGGFLQQKFPKKLLIFSAVPASSPGYWSYSGPRLSPPFSALACWQASPSVSLQATGFTSKNADCLHIIGFLSYLADVASNTNRSSLKMVEVRTNNNSDIYISLITHYCSSLQ